MASDTPATAHVAESDLPATRPARRRLSVATDLSLLLASLLAIVVLLVRLWAPGSASTTLPNFYERNEPLGRSLPVALGPAERALVIALDSRCRYCTQSMDFYKQLEQTHRADTKIVVVGKEQEAALRAYVEQHALQADVVATVPRNYLKSTLTPFMLLVSADGHVLESWPGFLDEARRKEVLRALR